MGLYKSSSVDPELETTRFQPLRLSSNILVSKFAFKVNLRRYTLGGETGREEDAAAEDDELRGLTEAA